MTYEEVLKDLDEVNQRSFLNILLCLAKKEFLFLENNLQLMFEQIFYFLTKIFARHFEQIFAEIFLDLTLKLDYFYSEYNFSHSFNSEIKACIMAGLSNQHKSIRYKTFNYLENKKENKI